MMSEVEDLKDFMSEVFDELRAEQANEQLHVNTPPVYNILGPSDS